MSAGGDARTVSACAGLGRAPLVALAGALTIAFSAILVRKAGVHPVTAALYRCAYAIPLLAALAWRERRRYGPRAPGQQRLAIMAGVFFAADLIFWHEAIGDVGAGLATVLGNLQVVVVPFAAWAVLQEPPGRRILAALPLTLLGVVLISGALEDGAYGAHPSRGVVYGLLTGISYAGFILLLRHGNEDLRRPAGPLLDATVVAAGVALVVALVLGVPDLAPAWPSAAWLGTLALSSQVLGWLLISVSLPRLPAALTSMLLTVQPVGSVLLGIVLLGESPSALQLLGAALILAGLVSLAAGRRASALPRHGDPEHHVEEDLRAREEAREEEGAAHQPRRQAEALRDARAHARDEAASAARWTGEGGAGHQGDSRSARQAPSARR
jgi:drug/metabolite transporter (DMT)-like permease